MSLLTSPARLKLQYARTTNELEAALRLRHAVFVAEHSNRPANAAGLDTDAYDAYCDHLIVVDQQQDRVVGTCRLLPGQRAAQGIGFESETSFDLAAFAAIRGQMLELGRNCAAPEYQNGRVNSLLWQGISQYVAEHGLKYLIGCASMYEVDLDLAREVHRYLAAHHPCALGAAVPKEAFRIPFLHSAPSTRMVGDPQGLLPPLIQGSIVVGAQFAGEPAYDPVFDAVDFFTVIDTARIVSRHQERYALA